MTRLYPESKVEINGFVARHYEQLLNLFTLNQYKQLILNVVEDMDIKPSDQIVDLGAGTGYNSCFMAKKLSRQGKIVGLDIGDDMIERFKVNCHDYEQVTIKKMRIDQSLPFNDKFDKALISFVLHGLPHKARLKVLENALKVLKPGGEFFIFDYGNFSLKDLPFYLKIPFKLLECKYAFDYLERDWPGILQDLGFKSPEEITYYHGFVRLLKTSK